jgi:hypothetical protein
MIFWSDLPHYMELQWIKHFSKLSRSKNLHWLQWKYNYENFAKTNKLSTIYPAPFSLFPGVNKMLQAGKVRLINEKY